MVNIALLDRALAEIDGRPGEWNQTIWRCDTGMCLAGHGGAVAGARWLTDPEGRGLHAQLSPEAYEAFEDYLAGDDYMSSYIYDPDFHDREIELGFGWSVGDLAKVGIVHVADWFQHRLGVSREQAEELFAHYNTRTQLQAFRDALAADPGARLAVVRSEFPD